jgi:hypothetical protein
LDKSELSFSDVTTDGGFGETAKLAEFGYGNEFAFDHDAPQGNPSITPLVRVRTSNESLTSSAFRKIALRLFLDLPFVIWLGFS